MAGKIKFAETLRRPLQSAKSDCLSKISTGDGIKIVSDFFRELDGAVGVLDKKYNDRSRDRYIQRLLELRSFRSMVRSFQVRSFQTIVRSFHKIVSSVHKKVSSFQM